MPDGSFTNLLTVLSKSRDTAAQGKGMAFDGVAASVAEVLKLCDRTSIIDAMQGLSGSGGVKAGQWVTLVQQADFMSVAERDLTLRFRTRSECFAGRSRLRQYASDGLTAFSNYLQAIEQQVA